MLCKMSFDLVEKRKFGKRSLGKVWSKFKRGLLELVWSFVVKLNDWNIKMFVVF